MKILQSYFLVYEAGTSEMFQYRMSDPIFHSKFLLRSLPKTIEFFFVLSNIVVKTVRVQINAIQFIFLESDV